MLCGINHRDIIILLMADTCTQLMIAHAKRRTGQLPSVQMFSREYAKHTQMKFVGAGYSARHCEGKMGGSRVEARDPQPCGHTQDCELFKRIYSVSRW